MSWWMGCNSVAGKRYQRRVLVVMSLYVVILIVCMKVVRAEHLQGPLLYVVALLPALPVISVLGILALYLREERDEYLRVLTVRSLIAAAGALLGTIVVNDFLRVLAHGAALEPFAGFIIFFAAFGIAQAAQELASRGGGDA